MRATAAGLLLAAVGLVLWLVSVKSEPDVAERRVSSPENLVRGVVARAGLEETRVRAEPLEEGGELWWDVQVHVPASFDAQRLLLALQAAAHNQGGRLDPVGATESGGYGRGALLGTVAGQRVRVLLLGDPPPPRAPLRRAATREARARLAIVLDDAGHSLGDAEAVAPLPREVAVAVLPDATFASQVAAELTAQGREVLLHLPMEPLSRDGAGPGEAFVTVGLSEEEIRKRVAAALAAVPGARGVNNHMGSRATADAMTMHGVMAALAGRGLYFLDSRTTAASVAQEAARQAGIANLKRDVFLDVVAEAPAIRRAIAEAVELAKSNGQAVAIGHLHPSTVAVLLAEGEALRASLDLVPPSRLAQ